MLPDAPILGVAVSTTRFQIRLQDAVVLKFSDGLLGLVLVLVRLLGVVRMIVLMLLLIRAVLVLVSMRVIVRVAVLDVSVFVLMLVGMCVLVLVLHTSSFPNNTPRHSNPNRVPFRNQRRCEQ